MVRKLGDEERKGTKKESGEEARGNREGTRGKRCGERDLGKSEGSADLLVTFL